MSARRVVLSAPVPEAARAVALDERAAHYVGHVLRLAAGGAVELVDGSGRLHAARLAWREGVAYAVDLEVIAQAEATLACVVVASLIKQSRWEWLLEKCCELGATHVVPLEAARSVVRIEGRAAAKVERWQRICDETAKQCQRADPPRVEAPCGMVAAIARTAGMTRIEFDEVTRLGGWNELDAGGPIALFVGPEGGLTEAEKLALRQAGAATLGLGRHLLRAETAVCAALAAVRLRRDGLL